MTQTSISKIDEIRTWIRNERKRINWTAAKLADEAKQVAARHGVKLNLQQQSISLFGKWENKVDTPVAKLCKSGFIGAG